MTDYGNHVVRWLLIGSIAISGLYIWDHNRDAPAQAEVTAKQEAVAENTAVAAEQKAAEQKAAEQKAAEQKAAYDKLVHVGDTGFLRSTTMDWVPVFKTRDAVTTVVQLARAGATNQAIAPYIACYAPNETKVLHISESMSGAFMNGMEGTAEITVLTGPDAGCKGVVIAKQLQK
jgi:hypothetical protein